MPCLDAVVKMQKKGLTVQQNIWWDVYIIAGIWSVHLVSSDQLGFTETVWVSHNYRGSRPVQTFSKESEAVREYNWNSGPNTTEPPWGLAFCKCLPELQILIGFLSFLISVG